MVRNYFLPLILRQKNKYSYLYRSLIFDIQIKVQKDFSMKKLLLNKMPFSMGKPQNNNPYSSLLQQLNYEGRRSFYYDLKKLDKDKIETLPYCIRILLENSIRNFDESNNSQPDIDKLMNWSENISKELSVKPASVLLSDESGMGIYVGLEKEGNRIHSVMNMKKIDDQDFLECNQKHIHQVKVLSENQELVNFPNFKVGTRSLMAGFGGMGLLTHHLTGQEFQKIFYGQKLRFHIPSIVGLRLSGIPSSELNSDQMIHEVLKKLKNEDLSKKVVQFYGPGATFFTVVERVRISKLIKILYGAECYFAVDDHAMNQTNLFSAQKARISEIMRKMGLYKSEKEDSIKFQKVIEIDLTFLDGKCGSSLHPSLYPFEQKVGEALNCKKVGQEIEEYVKEFVSKKMISPKVSIILSHDRDGKPNPASEIYVRRKMQLLPKVGITPQLIKVTPEISKQEMQKLLEQLNNDPKNTSTMVQLPFGAEYNFNINEILGKIDKSKNIDGFSYLTPMMPNYQNPHALKPPTALGIAALIRYYGIETQGKNVAIIGKGSLVGSPLAIILKNHPYYASVSSCDIFTQNYSEYTKKADIVIAACGCAEMIKKHDIKKGAILIDAGINEIIIENNNETGSNRKRKITGDICKKAYEKAKNYTAVPGGVGILTVSAMAFNVINSFLLMKKLPTISLENQLHNKDKLNKYLQKITTKTKEIKVMLLSSAYNGLTQKIDKLLSLQGYEVFFQAASSDEAIRKGVDSFNPDIIICPTLMKAIPEDIYSKKKCLIVHPGIRGDRGPSSIDWAILSQKNEWGVTILEANKEMDAGDIWASRNFPIFASQSKIEIYNTLVSKNASELILECLQKFQSKYFKPEKLNYQNPTVKGNLHRTIKQSDPERTINWNNEKTKDIVRKSKAAETQPGLKVQLQIQGKKIVRFTYGYIEQSSLEIPNNAIPGQIFLKKHEAVCVKTIDGAVWIQQMRKPKNKEDPHPFKTPSTLHLGQLAKNISLVPEQILQDPNSHTFQQITFERHMNIGIISFDFYNGAMSTLQCHRLAKALKKIAQINEIKFLVIRGSKKSWSNGIHLNVIENANSPEKQAWQNIKAINDIIKEIYKMNNKITVAAIEANAGAGGVYLGLACDYCFVQEGSVLNPHYKNMGLYGSQLHTLTAIRKFGTPILQYLKQSAKPILVQQALQLGLIDILPKEGDQSFIDRVFSFIGKKEPEFTKLLLKRNEKLNKILQYKPIEEYERQELSQMHLDMFENRNQFKEKREIFVKKLDN